MTPMEMREWERNMQRRRNGRSLVNGKPYRSKDEKLWAKREAFKTPEGTYRSYAPVRYHHNEPRQRR